MTTKEIRLALGLSIRKFAAEVGVAPSTVQRWENGTRQPSRQTMTQLAALMRGKGKEA